MDVASGRSPTDQEVEQARMYINDEHTKKLKEELPYISQYFETIPTDMDIEDNDGLSESLAASYEACEEWTEEEYRKLMMNFNRNQAQYAVDRQVKELAIQRDPGNIAAIEKEYSRNRERLDYQQKRGYDLMKSSQVLCRLYQKTNESQRKDQTRGDCKITRPGQTPDRCSMEITGRRIMKGNVTRDRTIPKSHLQQKEGEWAEKN